MFCCTVTSVQQVTPFDTPGAEAQQLRGLRQAAVLWGLLGANGIIVLVGARPRRAAARLSPYDATKYDKHQTLSLCSCS
jgi:hypothetical protein